MVIADRHGANPKPVPLRGLGNSTRANRDAMHNNNPAWSADGEWVYFASGTEPQNETNVDVWRVRPSGGAAERLTNQHAAANYPVVIDPRTVLYVARDDVGGGPWLWSLDVNRKTTGARISSGVERYMSTSASRDGRRIVATVSNPSSNLWRVPLLESSGHRGRGRAVVRCLFGRDGRKRHGSTATRSITCQSAEPATGYGVSRPRRACRSGARLTRHSSSQQPCLPMVANWRWS